MVENVSAQLYRNDEVVLFGLAGALEFLLRHKLALYRHDLTYVGNEMRRQATKVISYDFPRKTTVEVTWVHQVAGHFHCRDAFHMHGFGNLAEPISYEMKVIVAPWCLDKIAWYITTYWLKQRHYWKELKLAGVLGKLNAVPRAVREIWRWE